MPVGFTPYHGPQSGGTTVVFRGRFLSNPSWILLGDYLCDFVIRYLLLTTLFNAILRRSVYRITYIRLF